MIVTTIEREDIATTMYTNIQLRQATERQLCSICIEYGLKTNGSHRTLVLRIRKKQEDIVWGEEQAKELLLEFGEKTRCEEFEKIIRAFEMWCSKEGFALFQSYETENTMTRKTVSRKTMKSIKTVTTTVTVEKVDINEIRAAFAERDANLIEFFYMLSNVRDDWFFLTTIVQEGRECEGEYNSNLLVTGMSEIYNTL